MPRVLKCLSAWAPKSPSSAQVPTALCAQLRKCSSSAWVPECLSPSGLSARVLKYRSSSRVSQVLECPSALTSQVPLEYLHQIYLWLFFEKNKVPNINGTGIANGFTEFLKNFSEYIFYIKLSFLEIKCVNFTTFF